METLLGMGLFRIPTRFVVWNYVPVICDASFSAS